MNVRNRVALFAAFGIVAIVGSQLLAEPKVEKPTPKAEAFKPVLTVEQTMEGQGSLIKRIKGGILDEEWDDASKAALVLAELSNTNQYHNDAKDYKDWAKALSKDSLELAKALHKRDGEDAKRLMQKAAQNCKSCHEVYKK
ncbi:MAG: cytochrome c [Phycisphaerales bacterium]|nr:cytochrome c [Phycisphaerales bacterium]MCB9856585.1 cytochrome c [Phycisphaerales bacterium]MCB9864618.1 cytochrome c [Phycisphaerales bacterium]